MALDAFFAGGSGRPTFTKAKVRTFRAKLREMGLAGITIKLRLAAIRKLAVEAAGNGLLDPDGWHRQG